MGEDAAAGACPACAAPFDPPVERDLRGHRTCPDCGLHHAWPMEAPDAEAYGALGAYAGDARAAGAGAPPARRLDARQRAWLAELHPRGRWLDLGCGRGALLAAGAARGQVGVGLEFQPGLVEAARAADLDVRRADLRVGPWPVEGDFAHVTAFEVLEHLPDPLALVRRALGRLTPSGRLHLTVPTAERVPDLHHLRVDAAPHHLTLWTERALTTLLGRAGATDVVVERAPLDGDDLFLHHLWRRHGEGGGPWGRRDAWTRRWLHLRAAWLRRRGRALGHTLRAWAGSPRP